jgi:hypothetical protein
MVGILALLDTVHFEVHEEAFGHSVIPAITFLAHTAQEAVPRQHILIGLAGVLGGFNRSE